MSGIGIEINELKQSSKLVVKSVSIHHEEESSGERIFGMRSEQVGVCCVGDGWMGISDGNNSESKEEDELVLLLVVVPHVRGSCFLPARLVAKYSHVMPCLVQRAHVGLSLLHLTLEAAHGWQLSRSLGAAGTVDLRDVRVCTSGEFTAAMID